jgi:chorismate dehydratase
MPVRVSVIPYLNTVPFLYGLENHPISKEIELDFSVPSASAEKLMNGSVDVGIIPVAAIPEIENAQIISDYCIGAEGKVASVLLCSGEPLNKIKSINLDTDSRTSVLLARILAKKLWNIAPEYVSYKYGSEPLDFDKSYVLIGDKAMLNSEKFDYVYDLAEEWIKLTNKPFVFACWVTTKNLDENFKSRFNEALKLGVENIEQALHKYTSEFSYALSYEYLKNNISYNLNADKREGLSDFWSLALEELKSKVRW